MRLFLWTGVLTALTAFAGRAEDKKEPAVPLEIPVKAKLVAKKTTYTLDLGGKTGAEYREQLKAAEKSGAMPPPPAVDLVLEITNTSDKDVKIWDKGDPVVIALTLTGPGAVNASPLLAFTADFRGPSSVTLAPGKSLSFPFSKLQYGFRGAAKMSFWTEPGEYKLKAIFTTAIQPAPKGSKERDGFGQVNVVSEEITLKVEAPK